MLDVFMPKIGLQRSCVMAVIGQLVTAGVAQHVRMRLEREFGLRARALDHPGKPSRTEGCATLRCEHEGWFGLLFALKPPKSAQFVA
jgi:hypothetical protein